MTEKPVKATPAALSGVPVLHPPLLAIYRALLLYANNTGKTPLSALVRPTLVLALGAVALWLVLWAILRNKYKAGLVASLLIIASLTGWHVLEYAIRDLLPFIYKFPDEGFYLLYAAAIAALLLVTARRYRERPRTAAVLMGAGLLAAVSVVLLVVFFLAPPFGGAPAWSMVAYIAVVVVLIAFIVESPKEFKTLTQTANWFALILVGISVALILVQRPPSNLPASLALESTAIPGLPSDPIAENRLPDIYFVVLDGYTGEEELRQEYHYNNRPFYNDMRSKGFWIAEKGMANYSMTLASLASCMNFDYLQNIVPETRPGSDSIDAVDMVNLFHNNRLYSVLKDKGYRLVVFSPGAELMEPRENVDEVLKPTGALSEFESVLLETSVYDRAVQVYDFWVYGSSRHSIHQLHRRRVLYAIDELGKVARRPEEKPRFVAVQLLLPDPPFVFARDGGWPDSTLPSRADSGIVRTTFSEYHRLYLDQLHYTNEMLKKVADEILKNSARPPVIIIASTRGPGLNLDPATVTESDLRERFSALMMVYLPNRTPETPLLPPDKASLVNLFPATINHVMGAQMPLKDPAIYICSDNWPVEFYPVPIAPLLR